MRLFFVWAFVCVLLLVSITEGKKNDQTRNSKEKKASSKSSVDASDKSAKTDAIKEDDTTRHKIKQTSLPAAAVAQTLLPAATKDTDESFAHSGDKPSDGSGFESGSGEANNEEENARKPINVKSKVKYEKDKNKIAETVKKSVQGSTGNERQSSKSSKGSESKENSSEDVTKINKETNNKNNAENKKDDKKDSKTDSSKNTEDKKETENATKKSKTLEKNDKRSKSKSSHHHHHHHHHHKHNHDKKNQRPAAKVNPANEPKKDYPTFNWGKDGNKVMNLTARIPGWPGPVNMAQLIAMNQIASGAIQKDTVSWPVGKLLNGSVSNQADIATLDKASTETSSNSAQRDKTASQDQTATASSATTSAADNTKLSSDNKNPVAETVASDTGEVPQNISKTADVKIPNNFPARCAGLVKLYSNGELTLLDYLKQLRKCKKADSEFNAAHPFASQGNAMLRASISKNGPVLTKEAYKYALERMRNYVPSSKEKQAAQQILAKWRSNSFGSRDGAGDASVPDAIKNFMTGQTTGEETALQKKQKVQTQTDKAIDTAKQLILGTITGRTSDLPSVAAAAKKTDVNANAKSLIDSAAANQKAIITSPKQSVTNVIAAAKELISDPSKAKAVVLSPGGSPTSLLASVVKKDVVAAPNTALQNKAKAMQMAKTAEKLNAALLSQISSEVTSGSAKTGTDLLAALKDMAPGAEMPVQAPLNIMSSVQKRSINGNVKSKSRRKKRSVFHSLLRKSHLVSKKKRRRELVGRSSQFDNPIERSKLNKPIIPAPKLMDRIRDMSMIIATP